MSHPLIDPEPVPYGGHTGHVGGDLLDFLGDTTPQHVAVMLLLAGGFLYLLRYWGFRFNFGVSGGR